MLNVEKELSKMEAMSVSQLRELYESVFGEITTSRHKKCLIKRIIWRMQANRFGGLCTKVRQKALDAADEADLRTYAPKPKAAQGGNFTKTKKLVLGETEIAYGTTLKRVFKGREIVVRIEESGIWYNGENYNSLSAVAREVTGTRWNGRLFFGLNSSGGKAV
jgi:hypothetical protein